MSPAWLELLFAVCFSYLLIVHSLYLVLLVIGVTVLLRRSQKTRQPGFDRLARSPLTIPISIIIPAHNEEAVLLDAVHSALRSKYPKFEVIVVDDGSTDHTVQLAIREFELEPCATSHPEKLDTKPIRKRFRSRRWPNLWLLQKDNGGKADALNAGVNCAQHRYVLVTDADCVFHPEALLRVARALYFDSESTVGIEGQIRIRNGFCIERGRLVQMRLPSMLVARFQWIEYLGIFIGYRPGWSAVNCAPVVTGAFGVWRRDVVLDLGGFTPKTTHEDLEFTMRVHEHFRSQRLPYRIASLTEAIVWTEVPASWKGLYLQRKRWQRVMYEVLWIYRRMCFNPTYGAVGMAMIPYLLFYEALGPFVELTALILATALLAMGLASLKQLGLLLIIGIGISVFQRIVSLAIDSFIYGGYPPRALLGLALLTLVEQPVYRPVILVARLAAFPEFLRGRRTWEKVRRVGNVPADARHDS